MIKAIALKSIVAWRLQYLTYFARQSPDTPAVSLLTRQECEVLIAHRQQNATRFHQPSQAEDISIAQAISWIAQLGGYQARRSDPDPGVKVLWVGLRRLEQMLLGWRLASASSA